MVGRLFLLDTDAAIDLGRASDRIVAWAAGYTHPDDRLAVTVISVGEMLVGCYKSPTSSMRRREARALRAVLRIVGVRNVRAPDLRSAVLYARAEVAVRHHRPGEADLIVASIAMREHAILVTGNTRHFEHIPGLLWQSYLDPDHRNW